jgi:hypothetical protein
MANKTQEQIDAKCDKMTIEEMCAADREWFMDLISVKTYPIKGWFGRDDSLELGESNSRRFFPLHEGDEYQQKTEESG